MYTIVDNLSTRNIKFVDMEPKMLDIAYRCQQPIDDKVYITKLGMICNVSKFYFVRICSYDYDISQFELLGLLVVIYADCSTQPSLYLMKVIIFNTNLL